MAAPSFRRRRCCGAHHRRTHVPDVDYEAAAEFDQKQLADLTIAIGLINAYNRMAISAWHGAFVWHERGRWGG
jgi:hypothetical protein